VPEQDSSPAYYAVIPAVVRYDRTLTPNAKLLYGEITALCNKRGYCWAGNAYFADLYDTSERSIIRWINALQAAGYIQVGFITVPGKNAVQSRRIRLTDFHTGAVPNDDPPGSPVPDDHGPERESGEPPPVTAETGLPGGGDKNVTTYGQNCQEGVTFLSGGDDKNVIHNITSNIIKDSSSSPEKPDQEPDGEEAEKPVFKSKEELKAAFHKINPHLIFHSAFYAQAAAFLASHDFSDDYLIWLYEFCRAHEPKNLAGFYFKLFFSEQAVELFLRAQEERAPPAPVSCPACGCKHNPGLDCPCCGLGQSATPETIIRHTLFWNLPEEKKSSFVRRQEEILNSGLDFQVRVENLNRLRREYGLA
jgi:hypothetical protein